MPDAGNVCVDENAHRVHVESAAMNVLRFFAGSVAAGPCGRVVSDAP